MARASKNSVRLRSAAQPEARRKRGRPARLSRLAILEQALHLLESRSAEDLTLAALAGSMDAATMSLYNYFSNRDALLEAVADHSFSLLKLPTRAADWRTNLLDWLWALQRHFDRYPVVLKLLGWHGHVPTAWLRTILPVLQELQMLGFKGRELAFAGDWFLSSALGMMSVVQAAPNYRKSIQLERLEQFPPQTRNFYRTLLPHLQTFPREQLLNFGFGEILQGLARLRKRPRLSRC